MSVEPPAELRERLERAIARRPVSTREQHRSRSLLLVLASVMPLGAVLLMRGLPLGTRPVGYVVALGLSWTVLAIIASAIVLGRRSSLGRSRPLLLGVALALPAALALVSAAVHRGLLSGGASSGAGPSNAMCMMMSVAFSVLPLAALLHVYRRSDPVRPAALGAALGAAAASWSGAVLITLCPETGLVHIVVAHAGPIALMVAVSALLGHRLLRLRWIKTSRS